MPKTAPPVTEHGSAAADDAAELAREILADPPQVPDDRSLFTSTFSTSANASAYPDGTTMQPARGPAPSARDVRGELRTFVDALTDGDAALVDQAVTMFDNSKLASMVPDPNIRAAFAATLGTFGAPTQRHFLDDGIFVSIGFGPVDQDFIAESRLASGQSRKILINQIYRYEDFRLFVPLLPHEILHDDVANNATEEAINNPLTAMLYMQVLHVTPELAYEGTELTRRLNTSALAFINTREPGSPNSGIVAPNGPGVYPGGALHFRDFWTLIGGLDNLGTPGSSTLHAVLQRIISGPLPDPVDFSKATAQRFNDLNDIWLSDVGRLQISVLLQLVSVGDIAQQTHRNPDDVVAMFGLQPYLDAPRA